MYHIVVAKCNLYVIHNFMWKKKGVRRHSPNPLEFFLSLLALSNSASQLENTCKFLGGLDDPLYTDEEVSYHYNGGGYVRGMGCSGSPPLSV